MQGRGPKACVMAHLMKKTGKQDRGPKTWVMERQGDETTRQDRGPKVAAMAPLTKEVGVKRSMLCPGLKVICQPCKRIQGQAV
mmetsp:Transcript_52539/g.145687  ORF Transcript_52539/g.145687 Transcript_52539/m.145687 type:complete len:83 (-) Transcript_52539:156-404(-)